MSSRAKPSKSKSSRKPQYKKKTIALVYDFDGTLSPKPMQEYTFLPQIGLDAKTFWSEVNALTKQHKAEGLITYMHLMYKKAKERGVEIRRQDLVDLGKKVALFKGVTEWFAAINAYTKTISTTPVEVRHYMVSSGLKEIIEGTEIYNNFDNVFASEYWFEAYDLPYPKRVITDTSKTQYLFRINKGIEDLNESINSHMPEEDRPIPFENMIYFGDGETDVPSMTVMRKNGGYAMAVHPPRGDRSKCIELLKADRVDFFAPADYREGSDLFQRTCLLIDRILATIKVSEEIWRLKNAAKRYKN
ncbi:MAG: HAD family hydrolase [Pseudomonadota bacterium]